MVGPLKEGDAESLGKHTTDMIKFNFEIIDPDEGEPNTILFFRAFLDDFSDTFNANWNSTSYLGRAEEFWNYESFGRDISFGFKAAAMTRQELKPIYQKLVVLASSTAPSYNAEQSFMRGTLTNVTIGDYLVSQPGFITSVGYSWSQGYPWEIKLNENEKTQQLPHILDCSVAFTPIHRFAPQVGAHHYFTNPNENNFLTDLQI